MNTSTASAQTPDTTLTYEKLGVCTYFVGRTTNDSLPPITLSSGARAFHMQDYLTPDEADRLGDALKAMAAQVREASS
jgi:hypothetical protein